LSASQLINLTAQESVRRDSERRCLLVSESPLLFPGARGLCAAAPVILRGCY